MLINLSDDPTILKNLANDNEFLESLLLRITVCRLPALSSPCANISLERQRTKRERDVHTLSKPRKR